MCFFKYLENPIYDNRNFDIPSPEIAKEDIKCYKILKGPFHFNSITSLYTNYVYKFNKENPTVELKPNIHSNYSITIDDGYHSYVYEKACEEILYESLNTFPVKICRCIIPKGSRYYMTENLYVSSNIIILDDRTWRQKIKDLFNLLFLICRNLLY